MNPGQNGKEGLLELPDGLRPCFLNGRPAALDETNRGRLARVRALDGSNSALFTARVVALVMEIKGGYFRTRDEFDTAPLHVL